VTAATLAPVEALPTIEFVAPMPGFPDHRRFYLLAIDDSGLVYSLTSADDPELRFLVIPPPPFYPDYTPEISDEALSMLGVDEPERLLLLLIVTAGETLQETTANLMAPIVVDKESRRAIQTILAGSDFPVRAALGI
jgi:flagellar assembly factor FliW